MNVLIVGKGDGSWQMRGLQLGAAIGARVTSTPMEQDWQWADVVVLVKRSYLQWAEKARQVGVPVVWDALDFWRQPHENGLHEAEALGLLKAAMKRIQPALVIGATEAQAKAAGGVCLPHHARIGLQATLPAEQVSLVAYEGSERYLGAWREALQRETARRGWQFVVNPPDLAKADIVVAFREGQWDGWMPWQWKSGVKLANAIAAGRPVLTQASAAWDELQPSGSIVALAGLSDALDRWTPYEARLQAALQDSMKARAFDLDRLAVRYLSLLSDVTVGSLA